MRARPLKPWIHIGGAWRGGRILTVDAETLTIELVAEASTRHTYAVGRALYPQAVAGNAVVARIANLGLSTAIADYLIVEVRSALFAGRIEHTAEFPNWGVVDYVRDLGEPPYWPE
jgi:hypothetical protein